MTQGERVKEIRKRLGLTLERFGEKLGVQKGSISKIEHDERSLTDQMAKAICREYNVSYDFLIYGEGDPFDDLPQTILDELCLQYELDDIDRQITLLSNILANSRQTSGNVPLVIIHSSPIHNPVMN